MLPSTPSSSLSPRLWPWLSVSSSDCAAATSPHGKKIIIVIPDDTKQPIPPSRIIKSAKTGCPMTG
jgi:hypothetical protein